MWTAATLLLTMHLFLNSQSRFEKPACTYRHMSGTCLMLTTAALLLTMHFSYKIQSRP